MKDIFFIFIVTAILFCEINLSFAQDAVDNLNDIKLVYDQTYQIKQTLRKINMEINRKYREIQKIKKSDNLSKNEKEIKIRKLKRDITQKERESQRLKLKSRRIIS